MQEEISSFIPVTASNPGPPTFTFSQSAKNYSMCRTKDLGRGKAVCFPFPGKKKKKERTVAWARDYDWKTQWKSQKSKQTCADLKCNYARGSACFWFFCFGYKVKKWSQPHRLWWEWASLLKDRFKPNKSHWTPCTRVMLLTIWTRR